MIKLILFDFSGVCSLEEETPYVRDFAENHELDPDEFEKAYFELIERAETDEITAQQAWEELCKKYKLKIDIEKTIREIIDLKEYYGDMLDFARSLRSKYKTAAFSNYNRAYWELIEKEIDLSPYFDLVLVAYQVKARKTSPEGFKQILKHFNVKPEEVVFTDDSQRNLPVPKSLGIHTIHFQDKKQFIKELKQLGVEVEQYD